MLKQYMQGFHYQEWSISLKRWLPWLQNQRNLRLQFRLRKGERYRACPEKVHLIEKIRSRVKELQGHPVYWS